MIIIDCAKCIHKKICELWGQAEGQDASCYTDDCFEPATQEDQQEEECEEDGIDFERVFWKLMFFALGVVGMVISMSSIEFGFSGVILAVLSFILSIFTNAIAVSL